MEYEWSNWNHIFLCKIIRLQLIVEEKILKHRLSLGGVVSPNQGVDSKITVCED